MESLKQWYQRSVPGRVLRPVPTWLLRLGLGLVLAGGLLLLVRRSTGDTYELLLDGQSFSAADLAKMTAVFRQAGLEEAQVVGQQIRVPRAQHETYRAALTATHTLPAEFDEAWQQLIARHNPFASQQQNEQSLKYANQKKLERILQGISGIETASVQYDDVKKPGFPPTLEKRAMVAIRTVGQRPLQPEEVEAIRDTVVGYIAGLERRQVTVTDLGAGRAYPGTAEASLRGLMPRADKAAQQAWEQEFQQKIHLRLAKYPGVVIGVSAHLLPAAEADPGRASPAWPATTAPALITASIDVPRSYLLQVWHERHGPQRPERQQLAQLETEVLQNIERAVAALLPPPPPAWRTAKPVTVTTYDDVTDHAPSLASPFWSAADWLTRRPPLLGVVIAALASLVLWRLLPASRARGRDARRRRAAGQTGGRRVAEEPAAPVVAGTTAIQTVPPDADETLAGSVYEPTGAISGPADTRVSLAADLRRDVNHAVHQAPDAAAAILKRWMGEAA